MPLRTKPDVGNAAELGSGANVGLLGHPDLKRKSPFSDFGAPPKYARSVQSVHASSFDIEVFHEKLQYNQTRSSPMTPKELLKDLGLVDDLDGSLIARMDAALPGMRLKERLFELGHDTPQAWMDFLSDHGYINARVLDILRTSAIERIVFAPSMFDENGLNLPESNVYSVFGKADSFSFLSELSFANVRICDSDIQHIHHLPNLSALNLNGTGIGNEGVFLLVSLKRTLKKLSLATNPDIDNDAIPDVLLLSSLSFLSILDTSIEMVGLRRLAEAMHTNHWIMDIEIPYACEVYVDNINSQYLYSPVAPLITNSHVCPQLSSAALKRNLEAHAVCNASIVPSGTRPEMVERLSTILKIRTLDMLVISMLEGNEFVSGSK
ncbi:hypothetical protein GALMADRAFT_223884 [Galerina marginata CBS 339.88]|uniref:Uncharacterized protein n=1 Tax=Galerina marginata (strain CBS 339.88) TaxID=685588 RepID=A0A067T603_GALM3|nr:hypothetical protein GALMADRAFT_223884 [Galerina marginata CBS 339.88]